MATRTYRSDVVIIGGGLAGIAAAIDLLEKNKHVVILERDEPKKLGGLARESLGGVMMVGTPLQHRLGIRDNPELALSDWQNSAKFGENDVWPRKWAEAYAHNSLEMIYEWLKKKSVKFMPIVNWPERGLFHPGNSVPRCHMARGTGSGMMASILRNLENHKNRASLKICYGHKVGGLIKKAGTVAGAAGVIEKSGKEFHALADVVIAASGGISGGDLSLVRKHWSKDSAPPETLLNGSHRFADGTIHNVVEQLGGKITHMDKQWHCATGIHHPEPEREMHGLSLAPPRSALWVNACGERIGPIPLVGHTDTRYVVEQILKQPGQYSWQILNWKIAVRELAVSGGDYMATDRDKDRIKMLKTLLFGDNALVENLTSGSGDIVTAYNLDVLVDRMNRLDTEYKVDLKLLESEIEKYDGQIENGLRNDDQLRRITNSRNYIGDRLRTCKSQKINDIRALPLIAIREFILTQKSLGGIQTDLQCRVLSGEDEPIPGLYAIGEAAGFGGGGIHGRASLEGTFLGSCILTGRMAAASI